MGFVVGHMLTNHPRWHYATQSQRWRINAAANKIVRLALTTDALPAVPAGAATFSPSFSSHSPALPVAIPVKGTEV